MALQTLGTWTVRSNAKMILRKMWKSLNVSGQACIELHPTFKEGDEKREVKLSEFKLCFSSRQAHPRRSGAAETREGLLGV